MYVFLMLYPYGCNVIVIDVAYMTSRTLFFLMQYCDVYDLIVSALCQLILPSMIIGYPNTSGTYGNSIVLCNKIVLMGG